MTEHLRKIKQLAEKYVMSSDDFFKLYKKQIKQAKPGEQLTFFQSAQKSLLNIDRFMYQMIESCDQLLSDIEPLVQNISNAPNDQLEQTIEILSQRFSVPDAITRKYLHDFLLINKDEHNQTNEDLDITFDYQLPQNSNNLNGTTFEQNRATLIEQKQWTPIDDVIMQPVEINKIRDVRRIIEMNNTDRAKLDIFFKTNSPNRLELFDLVFNPKITVRYSPRALAQLYLRELGLQNATAFIEWAGARAIQLRREASVVEGRMRQEMARQKKLRELYESQARKNRPEFEKRLAEQEKLQKKIDKLKKDLEDKEKTTTRLSEGISYLADATRIASYYSGLEYNLLYNLIGSAVDDQLYEKYILGDKVNESIRPEKDLQKLREYNPDVSLSRIEEINEDYQEFRKLVFYFWRSALEFDKKWAKRMRIRHRELHGETHIPDVKSIEDLVVHTTR